MLKVPIAESVEAKVGKPKESKIEEIIKVPKILSPPTETKLSKVQKASAATPKRRRMANMLDAVLETTKLLSPAATKKVAEATKTQTEAKTGQAETEAAQAQIEAKAGPSVPTEMELAEPKEKRQSGLHLKRSKLLLPKLRTKALTISFVLLREKNYPKKKC
jgi:hypothetical protein